MKSKLNKVEQVQLRKLVDVLDGDMALVEKVVKYYFVNFNTFRGKYVMPYPGQLLYMYKQVQAHMLNLLPTKNDGQYDGNSHTRMSFHE